MTGVAVGVAPGFAEPSASMRAGTIGGGTMPHRSGNAVKPTIAKSAVRPLRVGFILTNNFTLSALSNFVDVLRLAADDGDNSRPIRCQWHIMSSSDDPVRSSCGLLVYPTSKLIDAKASWTISSSSAGCCSAVRRLDEQDKSISVGGG